MQSILRIFITLWLILVIVRPGSAKVIFVDSSVATSGSGQSWQDPKKFISEAITQATGGDQIWVRGGIYLEALVLKSNVGYYGGFAGNETSIIKRDLTTTPTIIDSTSVSTDSTVIMQDCQNVILDGFTLTGRPSFDQRAGIIFYNSDSTNQILNCRLFDNEGVGAWVFLNSHPSFLNCEFSSNSLTGLSCNNSSAPTVRNCRISMNGTTPGSSGIFINGASILLEDSLIEKNSPGGLNVFSKSAALTVRNCIFREQTGTQVILSGSLLNLMENCLVINGDGAGLVIDDGNAMIRNCIVAENQGRGIWALDSAPSLINCTITNNDRAIVSIRNVASPLIMNCIISNNDSSAIAESASMFAPTAYSHVENCLFFNNTGAFLVRDGTRFEDLNELNENDPFWTGNLSGDPLFADPANDDYHLTSGSLAIDRGTSQSTTGVPAPAADIEGTMRGIDGDAQGPATGDGSEIDIGAYEFSPLALLIVRYLLGLTPEDSPSTPTLDVDWNGAIDISDVILAL